MGKFRILFVIAAALPPTSALSQSAPPPGAPPAVSVGATSGGQTPQPNGELLGSSLDPYNSANQLDQYMHRKEVGRFDEASPAGRKLGRARPASIKDLARVCPSTIVPAPPLPLSCRSTPMASYFPTAS